MTDNVGITTGSDATIATDDCGAAGHIQRIKLDIGGDGVSQPFIDPATETTLAAVAAALGGTITVSGTVAISGGVTVSATNLDIRDLTSASDSVAAVQSGAWTVAVSNPATQYTEDAAAAADPVGDMLMAVRADSLAAVTDADGDNIALRASNNGELRVNCNLTMINGHSVQEPFNGAIYASILDATGNSYLSAGNGTNSTGAGVFPAAMLAQYDDTSPTAITENRFGNVRMSSRREIYNQIRDAEGNERGAYVNASNALLVAQTGAIPAGTNNIGDVDVVSLPAATSGGAANVASSATNVTLLSSNTSRKGFTIMNDSTAILYVKFGATASATSFHVKMAAGSYYESPAGFNYTGIIDGIWASANGSARVGEFT